MLANAVELNSLLDCIGPEQIGASSRHRALIDGDRHAPAEVLFSCAAAWSSSATNAKLRTSGPQHQTLRHRGQAPSYHRPIDLTRGVSGKLFMHHDRLVLMPSSSEASSTEIPADSIKCVSFYADCIEIIHGSHTKTLISAETIELLDLKFEVYYGRRCGIGKIAF